MAKILKQTLFLYNPSSFLYFFIYFILENRVGKRGKIQGIILREMKVEKNTWMYLYVDVSRYIYTEKRFSDRRRFK